MFTTLLGSIVIITIVMGLGFFFQRKNLFDDNMRTKLTDILINFTMPCTFFMSMQIEFEPSLFKNALMILLASFMMHGIFILVGYISCYILKIPDADKGVTVFAIAFANLSFVGFPILRTVFANEAYDPIFYGSLYTVPYNLLAFSFGIKILGNKSTSTKFNIKDFIKPVNISLVIGFICFSFGILIPKVFGDALNLIGQMTIPLSLMLTGAIISKSNFKTIFSDVKVLYINFIRLIVCPIIFYFILKPVGLDDYTFKIAIILSMLPSGAFTAILAEKYGGNSDLASKLVFSTTLVSLVTIIIVSSILL